MIAGYFNADIGVDLQFLDSCVAEKVMLRMAAMGIVAIPVHDSFICKARHEEELRNVMRSVFEEQFGCDIPIKGK